MAYPLLFNYKCEMRKKFSILQCTVRMKGEITVLISFKENLCIIFKNQPYEWIIPDLVDVVWDMCV